MNLVSKYLRGLNPWWSTGPELQDVFSWNIWETFWGLQRPHTVSVGLRNTSGAAERALPVLMKIRSAVLASWRTFLQPSESVHDLCRIQKHLHTQPENILPLRFDACKCQVDISLSGYLGMEPLWMPRHDCMFCPSFFNNIIMRIWQIPCAPLAAPYRPPTETAVCFMTSETPTDSGSTLAHWLPFLKASLSHQFTPNNPFGSLPTFLYSLLPSREGRTWPEITIRAQSGMSFFVNGTVPPRQLIAHTKWFIKYLLSTINIKGPPLQQPQWVQQTARAHKNKTSNCSNVLIIFWH